MKITLLNVRELTPSHWGAWRAIRGENPDLASPYFSPDFMQLVGAARSDVFVAVLESGHELQGFFPHQRRHFGFGLPVGGRVSDFHGLIAPNDFSCDVRELMRACGLVSWDFHALHASQVAFKPYHVSTVDSHYLDTQTGLEGYLAGLREAGSSQPRKLRAFLRKAEKDFKNVEFVEHVPDAGLLDTLLEWKSLQYRASGTIDNWSYKWLRTMIHGVHALQNEDVSGMLSALYFDGEIAALHMGMRSRTSWHWWFPRHTAKFAKYFPGILLLYLAIERAPHLGVTRIDLGYGDEEFKLRLRSGAIPVAQGRIEIPSIASSLLRWGGDVESRIRRSPIAPMVRIPGRMVKRLERWNKNR